VTELKQLVNNFDEIRILGKRFSWGKVNVTPDSQLQCSELYKSRWGC